MEGVGDGRPHAVGAAVEQVGDRADRGPRQGGDVTDARLIGHLHVPNRRPFSVFVVASGEPIY
jgi:hypothetical protein